MDPQYTKMFERHNEESVNCLHSDVFEELCVPTVEKEQALSAESLWSLSDESMLLFSGIDSSVQTSEASEFTTFSDIAYHENPSSIFNQSLEMFACGPESAVIQAEAEKFLKEKNPQDKKPQPAVVHFDNIPEYYNEPVVGREAEESLGWSFDVFENSKPLKPAEDIENTYSANPEQLNFTKVKTEAPPIVANTPNVSLLRQKLQPLPQAFTSSNQPISSDRTQNLENQELWTEPNTTEGAKVGNPELPWEWHTFEYKKASDPRLTSLTGPTKIGVSTSQTEVARPKKVEKDQNTDPSYDEAPDRKDRRKPKPIAKRFQPFGTVTVVPSYVQCLNIVLDYHGYTGTITQIVLNNSITNVAYQQHDSSYRASLMKKPLVEFYALPEHEELVGVIPAGSGPPNTISLISGVLQRKIHIRDIGSILNSVQSIAYVKSGRFSIHNPYEPQYYRYELDAKGKAVNESKCGMCAFCPAVKFLPFKNSSYLSHMTLEHGIFASNFVVPEGLYYGRYRMVRSTDPSKTRTVKALQCPACFQVIEVACWKNKTNPLLSYFRHFKKLHSNLNKTFTSSSIDPVTLKHRSGNISQTENSNMLVPQ